MAGETKQTERRGRRAHLKDFRPNEKGEYVYEGELFVYGDEAVPYRRYRQFAGLCGAGLLAFTGAAECLPATALSRAGLTMIPWLAQFIAACLTAWAVWKLLWGKNPMREYVYRKSAAVIPGRALVTAILAFATAAVQTVFLLVKGCAGEEMNSVMRPVCALLCGLTALVLRNGAPETLWKPAGKALPEKDNSGE